MRDLTAELNELELELDAIFEGNKTSKDLEGLLNRYLTLVMITSDESCVNKTIQ